MRPVRVKAPSGTIVNPVAPAACAARGVIGYRVFDAIIGALAQVVPERVIAGGEGGPYLFHWRFLSWEALCAHGSHGGDMGGA